MSLGVLEKDSIDDMLLILLFCMILAVKITNLVRISVLTFLKMSPKL